MGDQGTSTTLTASANALFPLRLEVGCSMPAIFSTPSCSLAFWSALVDSWAVTENSKSQTFYST